MDEEYRSCGVKQYEISNYGNLRTKTDDGSYRYLKGWVYDGYRFYEVDRKTTEAHILVAKAFLGERPNNHVVDHIDRNRANNHISNLRYATYKENRINTTPIFVSEEDPLTAFVSSLIVTGRKEDKYTPQELWKEYIKRNRYISIEYWGKKMKTFNLPRTKTHYYGITLSTIQ